MSFASLLHMERLRCACDDELHYHSNNERLWILDPDKHGQGRPPSAVGLRTADFGHAGGNALMQVMLPEPHEMPEKRHRCCGTVSTGHAGDKQPNSMAAMGVITRSMSKDEMCTCSTPSRLQNSLRTRSNRYSPESPDTRTLGRANDLANFGSSHHTSLQIRSLEWAGRPVSTRSRQAL